MTHDQKQVALARAVGPWESGRPTIVVLDQSPLADADISLDVLRSLGVLTLWDRTHAADVVSRSAEADILLINKVPLSSAVLEQLPRLRLVCVMATGYNIVDTAAAARLGIAVCNVPAYSTPHVAQHTFALLLELVSRTGRVSESVRGGYWTQSADFARWEQPPVELAGLTLGLIGLGQIGTSVAAIGRAMGMKVQATVRREVSATSVGVSAVSLGDLLASSDVISLHCPLTDQTRGLINRDSLGAMRRGGWLLNTARGPLIDEAALVEALDSGQLAGAGLDVLSTEPPRADDAVAQRLLRHPRCVITPHIAWASVASRRRLVETLQRNISGYLSGQPQNVVNGLSWAPQAY